MIIKIFQGIYSNESQVFVVISQNLRVAVPALLFITSLHIKSNLRKSGDNQ